MGFFSDLKDDLSQAVNELMPEEENTENTAEAVLDEKETAEVTKDDLAALLDSMEANENAYVHEEVKEKPPVYQEEAKQEEIRREPVRREPIRRESYMSTMTTDARMAADETSVITKGMVINGDLVSEGSIELVGSVNGNIQALGKLNITGTINGNSKAAEIFAEGAKITGEVVSSGAAKIGQSTVIIGNISATSAVIAGAIKGDIDVKGPVILDSSAIVMGNIKSKSVQINNGAVIEGMCSQCYADVSPTSFFNEIKKANKK